MGIFRPEKRGMTCKEVKADGSPCMKTAMYYAGDDGFCFDHKSAAIAATVQEKKKHTSRRSVEEYHGRISAVGAISDGAQRNVQSKMLEHYHLDKIN